MTNLPNPFQSAICPQVAEEAAASPFITPGTVDAAAACRFALDEERFLADIEPPLAAY